MAAKNSTDDTVTITITNAQTSDLYGIIDDAIQELRGEVDYAETYASHRIGTEAGRASDEYAQRCRDKITRLEEVRARLIRG